MIDGYIETVRVVSEVSQGNPFGFVTINKSDLTDSQTIFTGEDIPEEIFEQKELQQVQNITTDHIENAEQLQDNDVSAPNGITKKPWDAA